MLKGIELVKLRRLNWNPDPSDSDSTFLSDDNLYPKNVSSGICCYRYANKDHHKKSLQPLKFRNTTCYWFPWTTTIWHGKIKKKQSFRILKLCLIHYLNDFIVAYIICTCHKGKSFVSDLGNVLWDKLTLTFQHKHNLTVILSQFMLQLLCYNLFSFKMHSCYIKLNNAFKMTQFLSKR